MKIEHAYYSRVTNEEVYEKANIALNKGEDLNVSWEEYTTKIERLAIKVHEASFEYNQIVCIAKGGLRMGDILSRLFNIPLAILSVESYHGETNSIQAVKLSPIVLVIGYCIIIPISIIYKSGVDSDKI